MSQTDLHGPTRLVIRRTFSASRERVFAAFTEPAAMQQWMGPGAITATAIEASPRPGGAYRITMVRPDGEPLVVRGIYREVLPPERLVFSWCWEEDAPDDEVETLVTIELYDRNGATELVLTHENFASDESRGNHEHGWTVTLDQLATYLSNADS